MKKIAALLLFCVMIFLLAACGEKTTEDINKADASGNVDAQDIVDKALEDAQEHDSFSIEAVEYYLNKTVGLQVADFEPEWEYTVGEYMAYADDPSNGYGHAVLEFTKISGEVSQTEYEDWLEKIFAVTAGVSQDGYNIIGYEFVGEGEDALSETTLAECMGGFMSGWAFRYNDSIMVVYVDRGYDSDKDSEIGELLYYDGVSFDLGAGLQKSWDDTMDEMESYMEEHEDEIKEAIDDYLN